MRYKIFTRTGTYPIRMLTYRDPDGKLLWDSGMFFISMQEEPMTDSDQAATRDEAESFTFKAETKQLLNILIHSLYKDREVFLRELLSNASDALNRLRFEMLTNHAVLDPQAELCIRITVDKEARTLTIRDSGLGMTKDEIVENLGTIAQSGARKFIEAA